MFVSKKTRGFYDYAIHGDNMPADVVEITAEEHAEMLEGQSQGKVISWNDEGFPFLTDPPPPPPKTYEQVMGARRVAYADPLTGSDRLFAEATRLTIMGGTTEEIDEAKAQGVARYEEIQLENPWP